jgi:hypothetical protein
MCQIRHDDRGQRGRPTGPSALSARMAPSGPGRTDQPPHMTSFPEVLLGGQPVGAARRSRPYGEVGEVEQISCFTTSISVMPTP